MSAAAVSLLETVERRGRDGGERAAFDWRGRPLSWSELGRRVDATARRFAAQGVAAGDRVLLVIEEGDAFLPVFWGTLRIGAVAVPMLPRSGAGRLVDTAAWLGAVGIVADREPEARWEELRAGLPRSGPWLLDAHEAAAPPAGAPLPAEPSDDQVAFLQLTSGTTGAQKAVRIRHRDLRTNVEQMSAGFGITSEDVFLSWLPLHHDMGLILMSMVPLAHGCELHLLPPGMPSIRGWMVEAARCGATFTAAPDFAYRLCLRLSRQHEGLDLRPLRVALDAAEPVRASTVEEFERAFGIGTVITPAYGLAEATVGVSTWPPGTPIRVDARGHVAVGAGFPGVRLRIEGDAGPLAAGQVDEVKVASPSLAGGYWGEPEPGADDRWLATGDLGYLDSDGNLYVVGRSKEVINLAGLTLAPREIEETVDRLPFVRRSAAVGIDRGRLEGEQVFIFVELTRSASGASGDQSAAVVQAFHARLGMRPGRVCMVEPGTIPMTANGKVRYGELRRLYVDGELQRSGALVFPDA